MLAKTSSTKHPLWMAAALARIDCQMQAVAKLVPGSDDHRLATNALLVLQDSLCVFIEARALIAQARRSGSP